MAPGPRGVDLDHTLEERTLRRPDANRSSPLILAMSSGGIIAQCRASAIALLDSRTLSNGRLMVASFALLGRRNADSMRTLLVQHRTAFRLANLAGADTGPGR
jgi:hypothetical protein